MSFNSKAKAAKHTEGETLQPSNTQFPEPKNESYDDSSPLLYFLLGLNKGFFRNITLKAVYPGKRFA